MSRSAPKVVSAHHDMVASFEPGCTTRAMINARARSRCRPAGPNKVPRSSVLAIAHTAATWPCGTERVICIACPAGINCSPRRLARIASIAPAGNALILANVWCLTLPSSRKVRRTRCDRYSRSRPSLSFRRLITVATCIASEDLPMSTNIRSTRQYRHTTRHLLLATYFRPNTQKTHTCLLYTSDAADDLLCVDLGGRRIIKKKKKI